MNLRIRTPLLITTALVALALAGCTTPSSDHDVAIYGDASGGTLKAGEIRQAGSSTVFPLAERWAEDFGVARQVNIAVSGGGSGAGASGLCAKELDLGDMSRAMKSSERDTCRSRGVSPVEWKIAFDGLSVVVSKANTFVSDLTIEQLRTLFIDAADDDSVTNWNQVDPSFPDKAVSLCYPDSDSGTYEYFNEEILGKEFLKAGGRPRTGAGVQQSADDNLLVQCLANDAYAIGYFGYAYVVENTDTIKTVAVEGVHPTPATIADGSYTPLSRPIYIYTDGIPTGILHDYFQYVLHPDGGQALVPEVGYVPLDEGTRMAMVHQLG